MQAACAPCHVEGHELAVGEGVPKQIQGEFQALVAMVLVAEPQVGVDDFVGGFPSLLLHSCVLDVPVQPDAIRAPGSQGMDLLLQVCKPREVEGGQTVGRGPVLMGEGWRRWQGGGEVLANGQVSWCVLLLGSCTCCPHLHRGAHASCLGWWGWGWR